MLRRLWGPWDMRALALATTPTERSSAAEAVNEPFNAWWVPVALGHGANYEKFAARLEEGRAMAETLRWIAGGATGPLPTGATRVDGGVELLDVDGKRTAIPAP